ncbi:MAG: phenylalanine--tRNA ligase subunit beta, partial [bacterium]
MKISLDWLNDYIDTNKISPEELTTEFTMRSAEVESSCRINKHFSMITTSKIIDIKPHPNADKLNIVDVDDGNKIHTVVCGAPNIKKGQIVPLASVGTVLPGDFEIKPVKIRGIESSGMLCSKKELGIGEDHEGIFILEEKTPPGKSFSELYKNSDFIFEIENKAITHRPDMWGHYGVAREIRAIYDLEWKKKLKVEKIIPEKKEESFSIELKSPSALRYYGIKMSRIKIKPSPSWLSQRLKNIGIKPVNNIVDISNYVMLETGHPTHAFDRRKITGTKISVRQAEDNISFKTLDDCNRQLSLEDLVISDEKNILAIAGIMGGENSEVSSDTTEIFIESAVFDGASVRKTSGRLDLRTESSNRFEKSLPVENARLALFRFVSLVKEIVPSAFVSSEVASAENFEENPYERTIEISPNFIRSVLGVEDKTLSNERISEILTALEFS